MIILFKFFLFFETAKGQTIIASDYDHILTETNFSTLEQALIINFNQERIYFLLPFGYENKYEIINAKKLSNKTAFIGKALNQSILLVIYETIIIENLVNFTNLQINCQIKSNSLFLIQGTGNLIIENCFFTKIVSTSNFSIFQVMKSSSITLVSCFFCNIDNENLTQFFLTDHLSFINLINSDFGNITIDFTQFLVSTGSAVFMNHINFFDLLLKQNNFVYEIKPFIQVQNCYFNLLYCNVYESNFIFPFIKVYNLDDVFKGNIQDDSNLFQTTINNCNFLLINEINTFIEIYENSISSFKIENITISEVISGGFIEIYYTNYTLMNNLNFFKSSTNNHITIIDCNSLEMANISCLLNSLKSLYLESNFMYLENVLNKVLYHIVMINCFSYMTTPGIKIISISKEIKYYTIINCSFFYNNSMFYSDNNEIGTILYIDGNEEIFILNSNFQANIISPITAMAAQIGGPCIRSSGVNLLLRIIDSIFKHNKAVFDSNCLQFDGYLLLINNTLFDSNINIIQPFHQSIINGFGFGGSIFAISQYFFIFCSHFIDNMNFYGGNIFFDGNLEGKPIYFTIDQSVFINNYAHTFGACLYLNNKIKRMDAFFTNNLMFYNWANFNAMIFLSYDSIEAKTSFLNNFFIENWSEFSVIMDYESTAGISYITNCSFFNNTASWVPRNRTKFAYWAINEINNFACGGAIGLNAKSGNSQLFVYSENNTFKYNHAVMKGGVLIMIGGNFTDKNSLFIENNAFGAGTFFVHIKGFLSLYNSTIIESNVKGSISGILLREFSLLYINRSFFKNACHLNSY